MSGTVMTSRMESVFATWNDPAAKVKNTDIVAVLIALSLPWSTSLVGILGFVWLLAVAATLEFQPFLRSLRRPISALPIALFLLALIGTLWSDASWSGRSYALSPVAKLLILPFLFYHFERSPRGMWVFTAFLVSCVLMTAMSWLVLAYPGLSLKTNDVERGIFVKNYIDQSQEFALCAVALVYPIVTLLRDRKIGRALVLIAIAASFIINMTFVIVSRTALVTIPILLAVFAMMHLTWRANLILVSGVILLSAVAWTLSSQLQRTTEKFARDYQIYKEYNQPTSTGVRLEFYRKSLGFVSEAPLIGHGTGSTRGLFAHEATGHAGLATSEVVGDPHNQTLNVAVQWGMVGVTILYAMWLVHLSLFRGEGLVAWIGLLVVLQNFIGSLFNSHLFDFHEGWMYVLGVGVAGGMVLGSARETTAESAGAVRP